MTKEGDIEHLSRHFHGMIACHHQKDRFILNSNKGFCRVTDGERMGEDAEEGEKKCGVGMSPLEKEGRRYSGRELTK